MAGVVWFGWAKGREGYSYSRWAVRHGAKELARRRRADHLGSLAHLSRRSAVMIARFLSPRALLADRFLYATPAGLGLQAEDVEFGSKEGGKRRGWLLRG